MERNEGSLELLTDENSALGLVDYQPTMFKSIASGDKIRIKKAAICAAKAASIPGIPVVLSSINPKYNGEFIPEITGLFPDQEVFARKKLGVSGLLTGMCFAYTALHALKEGYEVYGLMDAAGDSTPEANEYGIKRCGRQV